MSDQPNALRADAERFDERACSSCSHWSQDDFEQKCGVGSCAMTLDNNDYGYITKRPHPSDRAFGWDAESFRAGVRTGPRFGCIHWLKRAETL